MPTPNIYTYTLFLTNPLVNIHFHCVEQKKQHRNLERHDGEGNNTFNYNIKTYSDTGGSSTLVLTDNCLVDVFNVMPASSSSFKASSKLKYY